VEKGDVLVSGIVDIKDDYGTVLSQKMVCADADILMETVYEYEDVLKMTYKYKIFTGKDNKMLYLKVFDCIIKLGFSPEYDKYETLLDDSQVQVNDNFYLPVHYGVITSTEYREETARYTQREAQNILEQKLQYFLEDLKEKGVQIREKDVKMYKNSQGYIYQGTVSVVEAAYTQTEITMSPDDTGESE